MKKYFFIFLIIAGVLPLFFSAASNTATAASGGVAINEIQLYPTEGRFIELYNAGDSPFDLTNWYIQRKTESGDSFGSLVSKTYFANKNINSHSYFLISRGSMAGADIVLDALTLTDSNAIQIKNAAGEIIEKVGWGNASDCGGTCAPNPSEGQSIQKNSSGQWIVAVPTPKAPNVPENQNANQTDGNPRENQSDQENQNSLFSSAQQAPVVVADAGPDIAALAGREIVFDGSNSKGGDLSYVWNFGNGETADGKIAKYAYKYPGRYVVSLAVSFGSSRASDYAEVLVYPAGIYVSEFMPNPAGADDENEWIEIANESDLIADISDFQISDGSSEAPFKIPGNTFIAPKSYLVFSRKATGVSLNNDADKVVLRYPNGAPTDGVEYEGGAKDGYAAARKSGGDFVWTKNATPGSANVFLGEGSGKTSSAGAAKPVSENSVEKIGGVSAAELAAVGEPDSESAAYFLPEVSAKTVAGYDGGESGEGIGGANGDSASGGQTAAILKAMSGFGFWLVFAGAAGLAVLAAAVYRKKKF